MNIKVTIEYADVLGQIFKGTSESLNINSEDADLDIIIDHFKRSCLACGFAPECVDRIIYQEKEQ